MEFMFEWDADGDRSEDSDDDDSMCSAISEPENLWHNWGGWRKANCSAGGTASASTGSAQQTTTSAQACTNSRDNRSTVLQDYRIGTARKMLVDIDAIPDPLLVTV